MGLIDRIKEKLGICTCKHSYTTRIDESYVLEDEEYHTFRVEYCENCGKVKSVEEIKQ
jgi:hypothetical protein